MRPDDVLEWVFLFGGILLAICLLTMIVAGAYNGWKEGADYRLSHDMLSPSEYECKQACGEEMWIEIARSTQDRPICMCYNPKG